MQVQLGLERQSHHGSGAVNKFVTFFFCWPIAGIVTLGNLHRFGEQANYLLNVSVSDGVHTSFASLQVDLLSTNRHAPTFVRGVFEAEVLENSPAGTGVAQVNATDLDRDDALSGRITYTILSDAALELFKIDSETGNEIRPAVSGAAFPKMPSFFSFYVILMECRFNRFMLTPQAKLAPRNGWIEKAGSSTRFRWLLSTQAAKLATLSFGLEWPTLMTIDQSSFWPNTRPTFRPTIPSASPSYASRPRIRMQTSPEKSLTQFTNRTAHGPLKCSTSTPTAAICSSRRAPSD